MTDSAEPTQSTPIQEEDQSAAIEKLSTALQEALARIEVLEGKLSTVIQFI